MHEWNSYLVQVEASKRLGATNYESNNGHNHAERQNVIDQSIKVILQVEN